MVENSSIAWTESQAPLVTGGKAALYNTLAMSLGRRIRAARKRLEITQEKLGDEFGISAAAVSSWERDETIPEFDNLVRLPEILKVPAGWLLKGGTTPPPNDELSLVWDRLTPAQKQHAMRYLKMLAEEAGKVA